MDSRALDLVIAERLFGLKDVRKVPAGFKIGHQTFLVPSEIFLYKAVYLSVPRYSVEMEPATRVLQRIRKKTEVTIHLKADSFGVEIVANPTNPVLIWSDNKEFPLAVAEAIVEYLAFKESEIGPNGPIQRVWNEYKQ